MIKSWALNGMLMIVLLFAALLGGTATFIALFSYGTLVALIAAPFGGSLLCALAGAVLYALRSNKGKPTLAERTDTAFRPR